MQLNSTKRTKILATIGPASSTKETIIKLVQNGLSAVRINFSHGNQEDHKKQVTIVREIEKELQIPIAIIQDLQGPKIRLGELLNPLFLIEGEKIILFFGEKQTDEKIPVAYNIFPFIKKNDLIYINDGLVSLKVIDITKDSAICKILSGGSISSNKGVNLPTTHIPLDGLTKKDKEDLLFGLQENLEFDYIAVSFVQSGEDIKSVRKFLGNKSCKIIAKIETSQAIKNLETIIHESDAVMIARGDLAIEIGQEEVPIIQRNIISLARKHNTPIIVATQMQESMTTNLEPTRAEVNDVATAVLDQVDCVMLSGETAIGRYPAETVFMMNKIIERVGKYFEENQQKEYSQITVENSHTQLAAVAASASMLAFQVEAKLLFVRTETGKTVFQLAAYRPTVPIVALTSDIKVVRQLALVWGITSILITAETDETLYKSLIKEFHDRQMLKKDDNIVLITGTRPGKAGHTNIINVTRVGEESFI